MVAEHQHSEHDGIHWQVITTNNPHTVERLAFIDADTLDALVKRAATAEAKVADYENAICWGTSCLSCSALLDFSIRETERAEKAEAKVDRARKVHERLTHEGRTSYCSECCNGVIYPWPCPTILALDDPDAEGARDV